MQRTGRRMGAVLIASALAVAACGGDDAEDDATATTGDTTETTVSGERCAGGSGGELTMGVFSENASLDPARTTQGVFGSIPVAALYDTLIGFNHETREFEPRLAESLTPNDDLTEWTLTLRPDITFGSGNPLDAAAVEASIARHQDPEVGSLSARVVNQIASMEVVDDLTLVFTLNNPAGTFPSVLAADAGMIVDTSVLEEKGEAFGTDPTGAGVGPFEFERLSPGEELVLTAKDDYWGGEVCLDGLRFVSIPGSQATYEAFEQGELDAAFLREPTTVVEAAEAGVDEFTNLRLGGDVIFINSAAPDAPLDDVRVRRAIVQAIDETVINERAFAGNGIPTRTIADSSSLLYDGVEGLAYDPDAAAQQLTEAKEDLGWDGSLKLQCQTTPDKVEVGIAVKAMLDSVGFDVELEQGLGVNDWVKKVNVDRNYELACGGSISIDQAHPATNMETYRSDNVLNYLNWTSAEYDALLSDLREATTPEDQAAGLGAIEELWAEEAPALVYNNINEMIVWSDAVSDLTFNVNTVVFFDRATKA